MPDDGDETAEQALGSEPVPDRTIAIPRINAGALFDAGREVIIEHNGEAYRLRVTSKGRLVLTK